MPHLPRTAVRLLGAVLLGAGLLSSATTPAAPASAQPWGAGAKGGVVYRWVDEHGVVHYGDSIPPRYAHDGATVLNGQGVVVGEIAPEKSAAQIAEAARAEEELRKQQQHDNFLLTTYTSVKDIEQLRDERIGQLQGQRAAAELYIANLHERLLALQAHAMLYKPYNSEGAARRLPDDLVEQLVRTLNEMRAQRGALDAKDQQEIAMRAQFQADIDRYRELRTAENNHPPG